MLRCLMYVADTGTVRGRPARGFFKSSHDVGSGGLLVVIRAAEGGGARVAGVSFCNIEAAGRTVIIIVPATSCAGRLVFADPVLVSLVE